MNVVWFSWLILYFVHHKIQFLHLKKKKLARKNIEFVVLFACIILELKETGTEGEEVKQTNHK